VGMKSKTKGKVGEREAAQVLRDVIGCEAHRGQQFQGGRDSPDVATNIDGLLVEVKRTEKLRLGEAMKQAIADCEPGDIPILMHRSNRQPWVAIVLVQDLLKLALRLQPYLKADLARGEVTVESDAGSVPAP
jgi:Holliday junction resolvase